MKPLAKLSFSLKETRGKFEKKEGKMDYIIWEVNKM